MNTLKHREDGRAGNHLGAVRLKTGWQTTQVSAVATVLSGAGFPDRYQGQSEGPIPFYKVSDMNIAGNQREMVFENNSITEEARRELRAFLFPRGSTIFPKIGGAIATNKKRLTIRDCCVDNNVMGVIPKPGHINSEFLFYFFLAHDLSEFANEAHLPSIRKTVVEAWPINLPVSLAEQQRIVAILDEAFEGIATARKHTEQNLQNAKALFESHLEAVFSQKGEGWVETKLADICEVKDGTHDSPRYVETGIPFITQKNIRTNGLSFDNTKFICQEDHTKFYKRSNVSDGDILISMIGANRGMACIVQDTRTFSIKNVGLVKRSKSVEHPYLLYYFKTEKAKSYIDDASKGGAQEFIGLSELRNFPIILVPLIQQRSIAAELDALRDETNRLCDIYTQKIAALDALKKSLLHQAFSGEL